MKIGNFKINKDSSVFIIAELSANHNGSIDTAVETIKAAKRAGADCIKLQTYTADTLTIDCDRDDFLIKGTIWNGKNYYQLYKEAYTPWEWHEKIFKVANEEGIICFSSPFDNTAIDLLEKFNAPIYKIASFEIQDIPLIYYPWGLESAAIRFKNSLQENSKLHVITEDVVEACHNGVVAWEKKSNVKPILIKGKDDYVKTIERWKILTEFFKDKEIDYFEIESINGNILCQTENAWWA